MVRGPPVTRSRRRRDSSVADLAILESLDGLLTRFTMTGDEESYLIHERYYRSFDGTLDHVLPVISSILGVTSKQGVPECEFSPELIRKYAVFLCQTLRIACIGANDGSFAHSVCLCFAALARRIEVVKDVSIRRRELHLLSRQVKAWVIESNFSTEELESALCHLLRPRGLTLHANTVGEWPAKDILAALLGKSSAKVSDFLELIPGTICGGLETNGIVLKRIGELCYLIDANLERFVTDDINQGSALKSNFSTVFNLLRLLFRAANSADEEVDMDLIKRCLSTFNDLYLEVQSIVRHEVDSSAETVLFGVFGNTVFPETILESVQNKISGPYDNELLSCCEDLFIRNVLLPLVNKRVIHAPGLSNQTYFMGKIDSYGDDALSVVSYSDSAVPNFYVANSFSITNEEGNPTNKICGSFEDNTLSPSQIGNNRNRSDTQCNKSLVSTEIEATGMVESSVVLAESTFVKGEREREMMPRRRSERVRKRINMGLLNNDSVEYILINSMESAKKMKQTKRQHEMSSEKRERMPFLVESSHQSAVVAHLTEGFDAMSSQAASTNTAESPRTKTAENKTNDNCVVVGNEVTGSLSCNAVRIKEGFAKDATDSKSLRKLPKVKLNFDQVDRTRAMVVAEVCDKESNQHLFLGTDNQSVEEENSAWSHRKEVPSKYAGRRIASKSIENIMLETTLEVQSELRPSTSVRASEELEKSKLFIGDSFAVSCDDVLVLHEIEDVLNSSDSLNTSMDTVDTSDVDLGIQQRIVKERSTAEKVGKMLTPTTVKRVIGTPGILKKAKSPSTSEKKQLLVLQAFYCYLNKFNHFSAMTKSL
ncbi:unnamed protein product [Angiostrongylus costaricensis]|uniref:SMK-1 domain-containing protein n=1 Tax=Angiostrongylus costaricensis TaxID=334426 RepID=A0A158PKY6_ANGCS|nr:unnamed protein product [Angiostrongylus costaricensis]